MDAVVEFLLQWGYLGLFIGAFLAATIIPFSSDVLLVGFLAIGAKPVLAVAVATLGNWTGGLTSYWLGRLGKWEWLEKYFKIKHERVVKLKCRVDKYGSLLALVSWLPVVGDLIAIALGFFRVHFGKSAVFMLIGKCARFVMWALLFLWLGPMFGWQPAGL